MANESNKLSRREHTYRIRAERKHYQQPSLKDEAKKLAKERGMTLDEATDVVLAARREQARQLAEDAKVRRSAGRETGKQGRKVDKNDPAQVNAMRPIRFDSIDRPGGEANRQRSAAGFFDLDPAQLTFSEAEKIEARKKFEKERARQQRVELRDSLVLRADAFAAFVLIVERKGLPAHVIDERKFAAITTQKRWDLVPSVLAWLIREDSEVKGAFDAFSDAAKRCTENLRVGASKVSGHASEIISEKYREMFLQAASIYARKLSTLESSLDRLSVLTLDELESLVADGDDLSKRIASISVKISDEIKRRDGKKGGTKANAAYNQGRMKVYSWLDDHLQEYERLDDAADAIESQKVVSVSWRVIRGYITDYKKLRTTPTV
ncbi:TPA: hypothetical protein QDB15_006718 [Burkholderia vietnamiensis]|nr:hypothetical protein [Burkholderia vietnamiensis]KVS13958.1 hypothetical protein WK32_31395 [Burkholderia vietnamiensis]MBR7911218.1 hypothetical protein [Burkholderia vietnamiensis]MCA8212225.1 hypothetical protein [Burkholderia vietnamiensis]HDR9103151.1 hypothetical protein [Burkholderia vietnamiensis]HDR9122808.1 hypothetical protein [Burkholderia vietnamiensis]